MWSHRPTAPWRPWRPFSKNSKFNSLKHRRADTGNTPRPVRHATAQETPVPIYIGIMLHAHTSKRELVDKLTRMGISISYDRVLSLSTQLGNSACRLHYWLI